MSGPSTYQALTELAEGWGLVAMLLAWAAFALWPFRRGARGHNDAAANIIFEDETDGE
jgi:cytochrome c oxidase cbb3-type subunit 4